MEQETCSICREELCDFETRCGHFYHEKCLKAWFNRYSSNEFGDGKNLKCPTCNGTLSNSKELEKRLRELALTNFECANWNTSDILPIIETLIGDMKIPSQKVFEKLFKLGWNVNTPITGEARVVHYIAKAGRVDLLEYVFNLGADINVVDGFTPLHLACEKGDLKMAKKLIELGANINIAAEASRWDDQFEYEEDFIYLGESETVLHLAIFSGERDLIKYLIENGADVNARDGDGVTPLLKAMDGDLDFEIIELLIKHGADITASNNDGLNAVHMACLKEDSRFFEYFLTFAPDLNVKTKDGSTMLHYAAKSGNMKVVKLLLDHGIDPNVVNDRLDTPLLLAMNRKHFEIVRFLVENYSASIKNSPVIRLACGDLIAHSIEQIGADPNSDSLKSHFDIIEFLFDNFDEIYIAVEYQQLFFKTISANKQLLDKVSKRMNSSLQDVILIGLCEANNYELFMEYVGRNYSIKSFNYLGETALFYASDPRIIQELISRGINFNHRNSKCLTAFMKACEVGNVTLFESLLGICDIYTVCNHGRNALYYAIRSLNTFIIKTLISKGINVNGKDKQGWTPGDWLIYYYLTKETPSGEAEVLEIIRIFKEAGAKLFYKDEFKAYLTNEAYTSLLNRA